MSGETIEIPDVACGLNAKTWSATNERPQQLVILCHGFHAGPDQVIGMSRKISAAVPEALFCAPAGPEPSDWGYRKRQWFSKRDLDAPATVTGIRKAAVALDAFIDQQLQEYDLPPDAYALSGFSQGAMMAMFVGLRRAVAPQAIVSFSGALIDPRTLPREIRNRAPVLLVHGGSDSDVPIRYATDAAQRLGELGVPVTTFFSPSEQHTVTADGVSAMVKFVGQRFNARLRRQQR